MSGVHVERAVCTCIPVVRRRVPAGAADLRRPAPRPLALRAGADRGPGGDARRPAGDDRQGRRAPADRAGGRSARLTDRRGRLLGRAPVPSAKHAASYAGLVPSTDQSGDRDTHGHITKRGSAALRTMLCEAAHHAQRPNHPLHPYFVRLCAHRGYKMAVVAVAHRLCRILFALLRDGAEFDVAKLAVEEGVFRRTTVQRYRLKRATASRA